jgi:TRAP-type C4-dicarboxylate transport system substrate-binding protein
MHLRRLLPTALLLAAILPGQKSHDLKLATLAPKDGSVHKILEDLKAELAKAPEGGIKLKLKPDYTLGESAMVGKMRIDALQAGLITVVGIGEIDKSVAALQDLPMMFRDFDELDHVQQKLTPTLEKRLAAKGFYVLGWVDAGWVRWFSRAPVLTPDDLRKQKVFCWVSQTDQFDMMKKHGFSPVLLEPSNIKTSLATGLIDALVTVPWVALGYQYYSDTKHCLALDWGPLVGGLVVSKKAFDALPEAKRAAFRAAALVHCARIRAANRKEMVEAIETMQSKWGLRVHEPNAEQRRAWQTLAEQLWPEIRGKLIPAELFDEVRQLLEERRKK